MLFEAWPHALFIVSQPGPTITCSYITVTRSELRSILCTYHLINQVIQALIGVFIAYLWSENVPITSGEWGQTQVKTFSPVWTAISG